MYLFTSEINSSEAGKFGNPCDKFIALHSVANDDITVKIVVPTEGSLVVKTGLFINNIIKTFLKNNISFLFKQS